MDLDDLVPAKQPKKPLDLSRLSIDELKDYIAAMEAEIARVREHIKSKQASLDAAAAFFKK
ncbi:MAG TPA: DUF1192 domain-containing protein [Azospirillaceae bacterium]|nr:DUF1192 domain-containing protein [Azospirillaceae bacterium]